MRDDGENVDGCHITAVRDAKTDSSEVHRASKARPPLNGAYGGAWRRLGTARPARAS